MSRTLKTCLMVLTWIFVGIFTAIFGATIIDLTEIAECSLEAIGQVLIGLHLAIPIGSIAAGVLCGRYSGDLDLIICAFLVSLSLSSAAIPWCPALGLMATVMVIQGVSRGVVTCCGNVMIVQMWKDKSSPPLHAMHFGTAVGSFIVPLMVEPFLSKQRYSAKESSKVEQFGGSFLYNQTQLDNASEFIQIRGYELKRPSFEHNTEDTENNLAIPYGIMAITGLLCAAMFLIFYLKSFNHNTKELREVNDNIITPIDNKQKSSINHIKLSTFIGSCANGNTIFGAQMAAMLFFFYACVIGMVMSYPTYLLPIVVKGKLQLTKQQGVYLTSGYWGSFAAGRLISIPLSKLVSVRTMLIFELVSSLVTAGLLAFCSFIGIVYLWIYTCTFAMVSAPLFPTGIAWAERYVNINGPLMAILQSGVGFGSFIASWLGGFGIERFGTTFPLLLNFFFSIGASIIYALMQIKASIHGEKIDTSCTHIYKEVSVIERNVPNNHDTNKTVL